jgi:outer membrane protein insertion porin family
MTLKRKWAGKDRVLTENMKLSAVEAIKKYYNDKGYRNVTIDMTEELTGAINGVSLQFNIKKGNKVKVSIPSILQR